MLDAKTNNPQTLNDLIEIKFLSVLCNCQQEGWSKGGNPDPRSYSGIGTDPHTVIFWSQTRDCYLLSRGETQIEPIAQKHLYQEVTFLWPSYPLLRTGH